MNAEIIQFLRELRANNNRPWFQEQKERYDALRRSFLDDVQEIIYRITQFDPEVAGLEAKDCMFRIYRDTRFSPDKTPYKTYMSAFIARGGRKSERGGYYIHLEPDNCLLSGGVWCPNPPLLKRLRRDIYDHIDEFVAILEDPAFKAIYPTLEGDILKRMPVGYPSDCPYDYILKHKDFSVLSNQPESFFTQPDWMERSVAYLEKLLPFNRFLNYTVDEYMGG